MMKKLILILSLLTVACQSSALATDVNSISGSESKSATNTSVRMSTKCDDFTWDIDWEQSNFTVTGNLNVSYKGRLIEVKDANNRIFSRFANIDLAGATCMSRSSTLEGLYDISTLTVFGLSVDQSDPDHMIEISIDDALRYEISSE